MVAWTLAGKESLLSIAYRALRVAIQRRKRALVAVLLLTLRLTLTIGGLGFVCWGFFALAFWAGLFSVGVSLLVLEWVVKR